MASPLKPYINGRLLVPSQGTVTLVNGRWEESVGDSYLVRVFVKRAQYSGVSSGSKKLPLESQLDGNMMPGGSGDQFYYRGYALEYAEVANTWDLESDDETGVVFAEVTTQYPWLSPGVECAFKFGDDQVMATAKVQRSSGVFGGVGIDEIIYKEIGGVEIQLTGSDIQN
jgi:hypothetical protein